MIPTEIEQVWENYLKAEQVRIRKESLEALDHFIESLLLLPVEDWHPWAQQLSHHLADTKSDIPIRLPLFRKVLFPALHAGLKTSVTGSARQLASFAQLLYKSPACLNQLPENLQSERGLLKRAIHDDPQDTIAKTRLLGLMRSHFNYALHELPTAVLYRHNGATAEQCEHLLDDLLAYEQLSMELGHNKEDAELIADASFHIPSYKRYLLKSHGHTSYEAFLAANA